MAKLDRLPSLEIIRGLRGSLDFYVDHGQPMVRRWPAKRTSEPSLDEHYARWRHSYFNKSCKIIPPWTRWLYRGTLGKSNWTWRDYAWRLFVGHSPLAPLFVPPDSLSERLPTPGSGQQLWIPHNIYYHLYRAAGGYRQLALVIWLDQAVPQMICPWTMIPPHMDAHTKPLRGTQVFCAMEPVLFRRFGTLSLARGFYGEDPTRTHVALLSPDSPAYPTTSRPYFLYMTDHGAPSPAPLRGHSIGPAFRYPIQNVPDIGVGEHLFHSVEPLFPIQWRESERTPWKPRQTVMRMRWWGEVDFPPHPAVTMGYEFCKPPWPG